MIKRRRLPHHIRRGGVTYIFDRNIKTKDDIPKGRRMLTVAVIPKKIINGKLATPKTYIFVEKL